MRHDLISDTDNPERVNQCAMELFGMVNRALVGRHMDESALHDLREVITAHKIRARQEGIPMPDLAIMVLPAQNTFEIVRADLDGDGIARTIKRLAAKYPGIGALELAEAVRGAFPDYRFRAAS